MDNDLKLDLSSSLQRTRQLLNNLAEQEDAARRALDQANRQLQVQAIREATEDMRWKQDMLEATQKTNTQLVEINSLLSNKLTQTNETLDFILNSMGGNFQRLERTQIMLDKDVQQLLLLISQRDSKGLKTFLEAHASDAIQIVLSCLSLYSM